MSYPQEIDKFTEKLNKSDQGYVVEEEVLLTDGRFEGFLKHDNAVVDSLLIYSGPGISGEKINNYLITIPSDTSWKRILKVFASYDNLYVTYQTPGDTVEAEDINRIQDSIVNTQTELNRVNQESINHSTNTANPHGVTKSQVGLGNVSNYSIATQAEAEAGTSSSNFMTPQRTKQAIDKLQAVKSVAGKTEHIELDKNDVGLSNVDDVKQASKSEFNDHINNLSNPHGVTKDQLGLGNVENKSSASIRSELSSANVTTALGFIPANHATTYTKTETDTRIQNVIDSAPAALDTLAELANALNNDADFASTVTNQLTTKVDKVEGKQLSTEDYTTTEKTKLAGIAAGANNYTHPSTHSLDIITETTDKKILTSSERTKLASIESGAQVNTVTSVAGKTGAVTLGKADVGLSSVDNIQQAPLSHVGATGSAHGVATAALNGFMSSSDKSKLDGIASNANNYVHPSSHPPSIIAQDSNNRFVTDAEKTTWTGKSDIVLGETSATAYRGDRGKTAYDHSQVAHAPSNAQKNSDITKAEIEAKLTGVITSHTHESGTPTAHKSTHAIGGDDALSPADILGTGTTSQYLRGDGVWGTPPNTTYSAMSIAEGQTGTATSSRAMRADYLKSIITHHAHGKGVALTWNDLKGV